MWLFMKSFGELEVSIELEMFEWGNLKMIGWIYRFVWVNLVNWNILVVGGRESKSDFLCSGEWKGSSLNYL